jgi:hypothetical protein
MKREDYGPVKLKIAKCKDDHLPKTQTRANAGTVFSGGVSSGASASTTIVVAAPLLQKGRKGNGEGLKAVTISPCFKYM